MWERDIRDWIERQGTPESKRWDESSGSILWHFCALFLQRHSRSACTRVHLFVGRLYRKVRKKDDRMLTFEETMSGDRLSEFGACMLTMWLLDGCLPPDVRILVGLAEEIDGDETVPVLLVMEAGLMVIDPTRKVTGIFPKTLMKLKKHVVNRCFDFSGSYTLHRVVVNLKQDNLD
jgi:hypothetical protein